MQIDIGYQIDAGNNIHIFIGEFSLCGMAWDEIDAEETHQRVVDCPDCVAVIQQVRRVRTRRPTPRAVDVATVIENHSALRNTPRN